MNNDNIAKIGTALKWRGVFDIEKRYYQENIVTMCGCVFRCKTLFAQGKSPISVIDDAGHITFDNTDVWDVIVDIAYYYNFVIGCNERIRKTQEQVQANSEAIQGHEEEISEIKRHSTEQFDIVNKFLESLKKQVNELSETHEADIDLIYQYHENHEKEHGLIDNCIGDIIEHLEQTDSTNQIQQQQIDSLLNRITVYSTGFWDNDILWINDLHWNNGINGEAGCTGCDERLARLESSFEELVSKYNAQQTIINKQQQQIEELLGMVATPVMKTYDEKTSTIYFADYVLPDGYDEENGTISFTDSISVKDYDNETEKIYLK